MTTTDTPDLFEWICICRQKVRWRTDRSTMILQHGDNPEAIREFPWPTTAADLTLDATPEFLSAHASPVRDAVNDWLIEVHNYEQP